MQIDKTKIREDLETAVIKTHKVHPRFHGVCIYGSFVTDKPNPNDLDLLPIFDDFDTDHSCIEMHRIDEIERFFESQLSDSKLKLGEHYGHRFECLADKQSLTFKLWECGIHSKNFIGTDKATKVIKKLLARKEEIYQ